MNKLRHYFSLTLLLSVTLILVTCKNIETISPFSQPRKIDKQLEGNSLEVSIPIDSLGIPSFDQELEGIGDVGTILSEFAGIFAEVALQEFGGKDFEIEPFTYLAPELDHVEDWSILQKFELKDIRLSILDAVDYELATLDFIKDFRIYIDFTKPDIGQKDRMGRGLLVASYNRELDRANLRSLGRLLILKNHSINWTEIIKTQRTFVIYTEVVVDSIPQTKITIGGDLNVSLDIKVGH